MFEYSTRDTPFAAYLACLSSATLIGSECGSDQKVRFKFSFPDKASLENASSDYYSGKATVDPQLYSNKRDSLMSMIHSYRK